MYKTKEEVAGWLDKMDIQGYTINKDMTVDVNDSVYIQNKRLKEIPVQFGKVSGDFDCSYNNLTTLEFSPTEVGEDFKCGYNQLTSLEGSPQEIVKRFDCNDNQLTSLKGSPEKVGGNFHCGGNKLENESLYSMNFDQIKQFNASEKLADKLERELPKQAEPFNEVAQEQRVAPKQARRMKL